MLAQRSLVSQRDLAYTRNNVTCGKRGTYSFGTIASPEVVISLASIPIIPTSILKRPPPDKLITGEATYASQDKAFSVPSSSIPIVPKRDYPSLSPRQAERISFRGFYLTIPRLELPPDLLNNSPQCAPNPVLLPTSGKDLPYLHWRCFPS